jgi:hypothetical protein
MIGGDLPAQRTIWKFAVPLGAAFRIHHEAIAELVAAGAQDDQIVVWMLHDPAAPRTLMTELRIFGTGHDIPGGEGWRYFRTVQMPPFAWHVFTRDVGAAP